MSKEKKFRPQSGPQSEVDNSMVHKFPDRHPSNTEFMDKLRAAGMPPTPPEQLKPTFDMRIAKAGSEVDETLDLMTKPDTQVDLDDSNVEGVYTPIFGKLVLRYELLRLLKDKDGQAISLEEIERLVVSENSDLNMREYITRLSPQDIREILMSELAQVKNFGVMKLEDDTYQIELAK